MSSNVRNPMDFLTKSQQALRGMDVREMTISQLRDWIDACDKTERLVKANKARRSWTQSRRAAIDELTRRGIQTH